MVVLAIMSQQPGEAVETLGNEHIESVNAEHEAYNTNPPTSGPHTEEVAPWGVSSDPIADENQIYNLEDGGVVIQYGDGDEPGEVRALATIVRDYETLILAPRPTLPEDQIAVAAWGRYRAPRHGRRKDTRLRQHLRGAGPSRCGVRVAAASEKENCAVVT